MITNIEHPHLKLFKFSEIDGIVRSACEGKGVPKQNLRIKKKLNPKNI